MTNTGLVTTTGFGAAGAVNAGLMAARILVATDPDLRDLLTAKPYPLPRKRGKLT